MTPLERVEALYRELVQHYGGADNGGLRAAAKLLLVAIAELKRHAGPDWERLLAEYVQTAKRDPDRFERILRANRTNPASPAGEDELIC